MNVLDLPMVKGAILSLGGLLVVRLFSIGHEDGLFRGLSFVRRALLGWAVVACGVLWMLSDLWTVISAIMAAAVTSPIMLVLLLIAAMAVILGIGLVVYWTWAGRKQKARTPQR